MYAGMDAKIRYHSLNFDKLTLQCISHGTICSEKRKERKKERDRDRERQRETERDIKER